jgi:hypothetical protein
MVMALAVGCDDGDGSDAVGAGVGGSDVGGSDVGGSDVGGSGGVGAGGAGAGAAPEPRCAALDACFCESPPCAVDAPAHTDKIIVAPSDAMPPEVESQTAHNNLDIIWHEGRLFFAFRTGPSHFASPDIVMWIVSTTDHQTWRYEGTIALGTDVREPRFVSVGGRLWLYYAILGTRPTEFRPQGTQAIEYLGPGEWGEPVDSFEQGFIPWRVERVGDGVRLIGYTGGDNIYEMNGEPLTVHWLTSNNGLDWSPVVPGQPVVLTGGVSETAYAQLEDGTLIAVGRNEAGDETGFGSSVCRAEADAIGDWRCQNDPRKYDSPMMFQHADRIWLVGRRHVTEDGHFDLMQRDLSMSEQNLQYQAAYWTKPKRCALWEVDPASLVVSHVLDLPTAGDTCFASAVKLEGNQYLLYDYSSSTDDPDIAWYEGQTGPTHIYRVTLAMPE